MSNNIGRSSARADANPSSWLARVCLIFILAALIIAAGCGKAGEESLIKIDGSSTVFPLTEAAAEEFQIQKQGRVRVTVGISGTGGGFKKFARNEIDMADASRPITKEEMEQAKANGIDYIELPICFDALTVVVNPQNDWVTSMTVADLKKIWEPEAQGKITRWNQIRPEWPDAEILLFGAGADSGTFDYFTEAVVGKAKSSRGDYTASEDDNTIVQGIAGSKFALGYLPFSYYATNQGRLKAVPIQWEKNITKEPVAPTLENVLAGTYNPLSRPLFLYVNRASADKQEVAEFVEFYLKNATRFANEVKYLPLPANAYELALARFNQRQTGTAFGGTAEVGLDIEELLKRVPKS